MVVTPRPCLSIGSRMPKLEPRHSTPGELAPTLDACPNLPDRPTLADVQTALDRRASA